MRADTVDETSIEHMENNDVPEDVIAMFTEPQEQECIVWRQYWLVVEVFARCANRWQYAVQPFGMSSVSVPVSFDWEHVERVLKYHTLASQLTLAQRSHLFQQLEIMEFAALEELRKHYKH